MIPEPQVIYEETAIAYYTLGTIFEKNREYEMALEAYHQAIDVICAKNNPVIPYRIGCCNFKMNKEAQAKVFFKRARKLGGKKVFGIDNDKYWNLCK